LRASAKIQNRSRKKLDCFVAYAPRNGDVPGLDSSALTRGFAINGLNKNGYPHIAVDHTAKQYVVGAVQANTIERFWSIIKRGIVGTFHNVSKKYLHLYVAEFQFRYNNRFNNDIFRDGD
jgi:ISXO2-like transposase domain